MGLRALHLANMPLELLAVDHRYGRRASLQDVTMTVRPGDCYGFIGHNGAGKSTALRIALGLDRPRRGAVRIDGFDATRHPREARARVGGTIESTRFYGWATARNNLIELARLQGIPRRDARAEVDRALEVAGLDAHANRRVSAFSQGMRQRLGLAQALLGKPRYVLLDEPHNGLDPEGIADLRETMRRLTRDEGHAVLVSSHQLLELSGVCNRVGILRSGRLLVEADTDELLASTRGVFVLGTDNTERARAVLDALSIEYADGGTAARLRIDLGANPPHALVRELVTAGIGVEELTPRPITLEEVYLRLSDANTSTAGAEAPRPREATPSEPSHSPPQQRLAPKWPVFRVWLHDVRRHGRRWPVLVIATLPAVFAWRRLESLAAASARHVESVAKGDLFSTSLVTGFEAFGRAVSTGLPVLTLIAAAFGSQSIAGDLSLGTLRNMLLRPVRRLDLVAGKALAVATACAASLGLLLATAAIVAARRFDFGDRVEVFRDEEPEVWIGAEDVWPYFPGAVLSTVLPILAYAAFGFAVGVFVRRGIWALTAALAAILALDFARAFARPLGLEPLLLSAHQPSPLGDTSYLSFFTELSIGNAEAFYEFGDMVWIAPATWCAASLAMATLLLARKRIP